jgi:hypothetical protein
MIRGRHALCILAVALISGCSGYLTTEHYEVVDDGTLVRYQIHDWYEKETSGPSIGVYRPPVYGFEMANQLYAIYPVFIRTRTLLLGPPLIPLIPESVFGESSRQTESMVLRVRHYSKEKPLVKPVTIGIGNPVTKTISLEQGSADAVGTIYSVTLPISSEVSRFTILLTLSDGTSKTIEFAYRSDRFYSPLFSFNGPEPRPSFERYPE